MEEKYLKLLLKKYSCRIQYTKFPKHFLLSLQLYFGCLHHTFYFQPHPTFHCFLYALFCFIPISQNNFYQVQKNDKKHFNNVKNIKKLLTNIYVSIIIKPQNIHQFNSTIFASVPTFRCVKQRSPRIYHRFLKRKKDVHILQFQSSLGIFRNRNVNV